MTPLLLSHLRPGDRVVLITLDNRRYTVEVTSARNGSARGRRIGLNASKGQTEQIYSGSLLCKEGQPEVRWAGNLVPDDLVYTPEYRSGLQYAKAALIDDRTIGLIRWNEAKREWLKHPQHVCDPLEWLAHESEPEALKKFFRRIDEDRAHWQASPGRPRWMLDRVTGAFYWHEKRRRWD
jgi:hypothetical protein